LLNFVKAERSGTATPMVIGVFDDVLEVPPELLPELLQPTASARAAAAPITTAV
jgi:hypothetical protein